MVRDKLKAVVAGYGGVEFEPVPGRSTHLIFARNTPAAAPAGTTHA